MKLILPVSLYTVLLAVSLGSLGKGDNPTAAGGGDSAAYLRMLGSLRAGNSTALDNDLVLGASQPWSYTSQGRAFEARLKVRELNINHVLHTVSQGCTELVKV